MVAAAEHRYRSWYPRRHVLLLDYERSDLGRCCCGGGQYSFLTIRRVSTGRSKQSQCWRGAPAGLSKRRQSNRRLLPAPAKNQAPLYREAREKMTNDLISDKG